jgi:hypothetical protein
MLHPDDGPFWEIVHEAEEAINLGATVFQKFTCPVCLARETMTEPNVFYKEGRCDECAFVADLVKQGCGFMLIASSDPEMQEQFVQELKERIAAAKPRNLN